MKLTELLTIPGTHVWPFTRESAAIKTVGDAHRRLQTYLTYDKYRHVTARGTGVILTNVTTYQSEPALVIEVA